MNYCMLFPVPFNLPYCIQEAIQRTKEQLSVAIGIKPLSDQEIERIKAELQLDIQRAGGSALDVSLALAEVDRHVEQLQEQVPVPPAVVIGTAGNFFDRFEGLIYGVAIGLAAYAVIVGFKTVRA